MHVVIMVRSFDEEKQRERERELEQKYIYIYVFNSDQGTDGNFPSHRSFPFPTYP